MKLAVIRKNAQFIFACVSICFSSDHITFFSFINEYCEMFIFQTENEFLIQLCSLHFINACFDDNVNELFSACISNDKMHTMLKRVHAVIHQSHAATDVRSIT